MTKARGIVFRSPSSIPLVAANVSFVAVGSQVRPRFASLLVAAIGTVVAPRLVVAAVGHAVRSMMVVVRPRNMVAAVVALCVEGDFRADFYCAAGPLHAPKEAQMISPRTALR